jgi:hypothetical protein
VSDVELFQDSITALDGSHAKDDGTGGTAR